MTAAVSEVVRLYRDERLSMDKVAAKTGCSTWKVRRILGNEGVPARPRGRASTLSGEQMAAIAEAVRTGAMTRAQAAEASGAGHDVIHRALKEAGAVPAPDEDWLLPRTAAALAGTDRNTLAALARAGLVQTRRGTARGWRLYSRAEMAALAGRREAGAR